MSPPVRFVKRSGAPARRRNLNPSPLLENVKSVNLLVVDAKGLEVQYFVLPIGTKEGACERDACK